MNAHSATGSEWPVISDDIASKYQGGMLRPWCRTTGYEVPAFGFAQTKSKTRKVFEINDLGRLTTVAS